jgi:hypothetical protein
MDELKKIDYHDELIPFPLVFNRLGIIFHLPKEETVMLLDHLESEGHIKIVPFHGIQVLKNDL